MVDLIPRNVLFGNPERISPHISPDGSRLAWIAPREGVLNVWVAPIGTSGVDWDDATVVTDDTDRGIRMFAWAKDGRHLLYLQDTGGDENWRLYDVDLETMAKRDLTPYEGIQARVIATRKSHRDEVLVGLNRDNPQLHDVYRLDLKTGELAKLIENPGYAGWLADEDMVVRGALAPLPDGGFDLLVRDDAEGDWRTLLTIPADDAPASDALAFSGDGKSLLAISSVGVNTGRLVRIDLASGEDRVLLEDPDADVAGAMLHPDTREPQIALVLKDRAEYHVLDPAVQPDYEAIRALHTGDPSLIGRDEADTTWLVAFTDDAGPVRYYGYDRATGTGSFLFDSRPELSRYELAHMEPFSFTTRDGLTVHGYVTFPPGGGRSGLPAVLDVHGGPQVRDVWGWNPEAQWFANRGYLCIQVNYRGSTGYGKAFVNAGDREWGAKMHDDLINAVGYVVEQGWADRDRIAIYGGSYGGYAALVGAAFTPYVFRCAVEHRRPVEPADAPGDDPALLGAGEGTAVQAGRQPGNGPGVPVVPVAAVPGPGHPDPAADRPGRQRPAGQAGRVRADRRRAGRGRDRLRVHAVPRRGPRLRQAGEPAEVLRRGRALPGQVPGRPFRGVRRVAGLLPGNETRGSLR